MRLATKHDLPEPINRDIGSLLSPSPIRTCFPLCSLYGDHSALGSRAMGAPPPAARPAAQDGVQLSAVHDELDQR